MANMGIYHFIFIITLQMYVSFASPALTNVALGKTASHTDTYESNDAVYGASNAVDGGLSQYVGDGSCTHTESEGVSWEVDLSEVFVIDHVIIYNRLEHGCPTCASSRLRNVEIYLGFSKTNYVLVGYSDGIAGSTVTFLMDSLVHGRWIKITRLNPEGALTLCEVIVMGYRPTGTYSLHPQTQSTGAALLTAMARTTQQCGYTCFRSVKCVSASFHKSTNSCSLFHSSEFITSPDPDDVFMLPFDP